MNSKIFFAIIILAAAFSINAVTLETGVLKDFLYGSEPECAYDNYVSHVAEGIARTNYNLYAPWEQQTSGFGNFHLPSDHELMDWALVYLNYLNGDLENAEALIDSFGFPYEVVEFHDTYMNRDYWILRENLDFQYFDDNGTPETEDDEYGAFDWGWGFYLYNPDASQPVIISAPHPNDDFITVPVAVECLQQWDAMFLFISGAGREVMWTEIGSYSNSKSLSDPTRNSAHPLIYANQMAVNLIRESWRHEFAAQIHSYDWNRHANHANCQFSVVQSNPNLPLRDFSDLHDDMINQAEFLMVPAGSYGNHSDSFLNDYYSVYYTQYPFQYVNEDTVITVNNYIDLPGVGGDFLYYSVDNWNHYDVYDPFLHVEMDELPNEFAQQTSQLYDFYGYDQETGIWQQSNRFSKALGWYNRWVEDLAAVIPNTIALDDNLIPAAPDSIWCNNISDSSIRINWQPVPAYDHFSYRIYIDTAFIDTTTTSYIDRGNLSILASSLHDNFTFDGLEINQIYYMMIAVEDYNDNIICSEQVSVYTAPAVVEDFDEFGGDALVELHWTAAEQSENNGFNVYRTNTGNDYELIAEWENHPELVSNGGNNQLFTFTDYDIDNNYLYYYKISMDNDEEVEFFFDQYVMAKPRSIYQITFSNDNGLSSSLDFSWNFYATNNFDDYYDLPCSSYQDEELYSAIYQPEWSSSWLSREIKMYYNPVSGWADWNIEILSQLPNDSLSIEISENYPDYYRLYLLNENTGNMKLLYSNDNCYISLDENGETSLRLFAGNLQPDIEISESPNQLYQPQDQLIIEYEAEFTQLIEHYSVILHNQFTDIVIQDSTSSSLPEQIIWTVPDSISAQNLTPRIYYTTDTGAQYLAEADYEIGIISSQYAYNIPAGWHNFSNVWIDSLINITEIFGEDAELFSYSDNGYIQQDTAQAGTGYWLQTTYPVTFTGEGLYQTQELQITLDQGWNLLANPFPCQLSIEGLLFEYFGITRDFKYMVEHEYLSHNVYAYRDSAFTHSLTIEPGESFYLYNLIDESLEINAKFIPGNSGTPIMPINPFFRLGIEISQLNDNHSCFLGAAANTTDFFDPEFDFPALPPKPDSQGCRIAVSVFPTTYPETYFQTIFMGSFWNNPIKQHDIVMFAQPDQSAVITFDKELLPLDYFCWMETGSEFIDLDLNNRIELDFPETGYIAGSVFIEFPRTWHYGDINKNGSVEALDAALTLQYSVGIDPAPIAPLPWQQWRFTTADVDGDQEIISYDAALILQYCVDFIDEFPVESRKHIIPPVGDVSLIRKDNTLQVYSKGNLYSLKLLLNSEIIETNLYADVLSAENYRENLYQFAAASAYPLPSGTLIAELVFPDDSPVPSKADIYINGILKEADIIVENVYAVTKLLPVSPNPMIFNVQRSCSFDFCLAEPAECKFSIYNFKGQKVKSLHTNSLERGEHQISWDFTNSKGKMVSSGVYFISMNTQNYQKMRKFVFVK